MKRSSNPMTAAPTLIALGLCLAMAPVLQAQALNNSDMSVTTSLPATVSPGVPFTVTSGYANLGPNTATSAYVNAYSIPPVGLDVFLDNTLYGDGSMYDALQATADGTDTLGNVPKLFWDDNYCEDILFQLQGDDQPEASPIQPLASGASGSFTYQVTIPMENPKSGAITITEPASLAQTWTGQVGGVFYAASNNTYGRGSCEKWVGTEEEEMCAYINDNCFGARISQLPEPIEAEFELVNDGSANPTQGCEAFVDFTPGNIAILRRGTCQFGSKAFNAEQAGASAMIMVFDDNCNGLATSDQCTFGMLAGDLGQLVTIPVASLAQADGEPIIAALDGGATVRGIIGDPSVFGSQTNVFLADAAHTDPDDSNDDAFATAELTVVSNPPVASFTYAPSAPITGSAVQFTDTSTGGPTEWAWDFGDGGTSTEQNPSHAFSSAGTFTVSLTATNSAGSSSASMDVVVTLGAELTESYFIPAAALAAGAEGSFFQTDVDINSNSGSEASYAFLWLPRNTDNSTPTQSDTYTIGAGESVRYENVLAEVFGAEPDVAGALAVISNTANLNIMSRTYDVPTAKVTGTFGQALPGVPADQLIMQGETKRITFMSETDDLRANVGCVNGVNDSVRIAVNMYDDAGILLETRNMDLGPWSNNQFNRIFQSYAPTNGYVDVIANKPGAAFYCYGSVLDNGSNDPTSILPTEYGADTPFVTYFIPAAAAAAGLEGSFFQTDVDINNAGSAMATYQFLWLPRGSDNSAPLTSDSFTLEAGEGARYENVLFEVFGLEPDVAGALAISADSAFLGINSRTYNVPTAKVTGTFGQAIPGIPADNLIMQGETKRIIFMSENDDLRANLGCVNGVNDSVRIAVTMYDDTGAMLETKNMDLGPWSNNQFNRLFQNYSPTNGYVDVTSSKAGAAYYCYGSVLDNGSSDPTTILPQ
jgi:PKD repeat protein